MGVGPDPSSGGSSGPSPALVGLTVTLVVTVTVGLGVRRTRGGSVLLVGVGFRVGFSVADGVGVAFRRGDRVGAGLRTSGSKLTGPPADTDTDEETGPGGGVSGQVAQSPNPTPAARTASNPTVSRQGNPGGSGPRYGSSGGGTGAGRGL